MDELMSVRLPVVPQFFQIDILEERYGVLDLGSKAPTKKQLGVCTVPLETKFGRRPCTWAIVKRPSESRHRQRSKEVPDKEVGCLVLKYTLARTPGAVRNLRVVEGSTGPTEVQLAWDALEGEGAGAQIRGYRAEAEVQESDDATCTGLSHAPSAAGGLQVASAPATAEPFVVVRGLRGNKVYAFRVWAVSEAGFGPKAVVLGRTGPVAPGACGQPRLAEADAVEWEPPRDTGGAVIVAYRMWIRPLFHDSLGRTFPSEGWIDLGLLEHRGPALSPQRAPLRRLGAAAAAAGAICSVAALNAAGETGPSSPEAPLLHPAAARGPGSETFAPAVSAARTAGPPPTAPPEPTEEGEFPRLSLEQERQLEACGIKLRLEVSGPTAPGLGVSSSCGFCGPPPSSFRHADGPVRIDDV